MSKKIELRVQAHREKCKPTIMKTVAKVSGVKSLSLDAEKGVLTITGTVDVVEVVKQLKKADRPAEVISVGPEKPPEKEEKKDEKKDDKKNGDKKDGDKEDGDKKDGDKKDGDKKDGDKKKNGDKKEEKKHECNQHVPCYCNYPYPPYHMPPPPPACPPPVVIYDQPPNCTIS